MTGADRYLTDQVRETVHAEYLHKRRGLEGAVRAALAVAYPLIRADVLREAADQFERERIPVEFSRAVGLLRHRADEAVAGD